MPQKHIFIKSYSLGVKRTKDNIILQICRIQNSQAKIQKDKSLFQRNQFSESFRRNQFLEQWFLPVRQSPGMPLKRETTVLLPQTFSFSWSMIRPRICIYSKLSDDANALFWGPHFETHGLSYQHREGSLCRAIFGITGLISFLLLPLLLFIFFSYF